MKHYGVEPPWEGKDLFGLRWDRGEELWDGGWVWHLRTAFHGTSVSDLTSLLKKFYVTPMQAALNEESTFLRLMTAEDIRVAETLPEPKVSLLTRLRMRLGLPVFK